MTTRRGGAVEPSRRRSGAGMGAVTLATVKGQRTSEAAAVNERVRMEERARTCEDEDMGRGSFATGLRRRCGCANPRKDGNETRRRGTVSWDGGVRGWRSAVPAKTTAATRWVRGGGACLGENPSEVDRLLSEAKRMLLPADRARGASYGSASARSRAKI
jgi:hypothetical protein